MASYGDAWVDAFWVLFLSFGGGAFCAIQAPLRGLPLFAKFSDFWPFRAFAGLAFRAFPGVAILGSTSSASRILIAKREAQILIFEGQFWGHFRVRNHRFHRFSTSHHTHTMIRAFELSHPFGEGLLWDAWVDNPSSFGGFLSSLGAEVVALGTPFEAYPFLQILVIFSHFTRLEFIHFRAFPGLAMITMISRASTILRPISDPQIDRFFIQIIDLRDSDPPKSRFPRFGPQNGHFWSFLRFGLPL